MPASGLLASGHFWAKVVPTEADACWIWVGPVSERGYGVFTDPARPRKRRCRAAHRYAYEELRTSIPPGLVLDHLCRTPLCVNPWHLEPVTQRVNTLRGVSVVAAQAVQTHCL